MVHHIDPARLGVRDRFHLAGVVRDFFLHLALEVVHAGDVAAVIDALAKQPFGYGAGLAKRYDDRAGGFIPFRVGELLQQRFAGKFAHAVASSSGLAFGLAGGCHTSGLNGGSRSLPVKRGTGYCRRPLVKAGSFLMSCLRIFSCK